jgi:hypothetical protein
MSSFIMTMTAFNVMTQLAFINLSLNLLYEYKK